MIGSIGLDMLFGQVPNEIFFIKDEVTDEDLSSSYTRLLERHVILRSGP
uniref:Uncharacterized protein ORF48 n=1 Tax=Zea mays TaxID=4577 RepID=Q36278_MAIZE|nr:unknown [Zea mays]